MCLFAAARAAAPAWFKYNLSAADYPNARCLDGSMGAYYLLPGTDLNFVLHIQGGGWCTSLDDCAARARFPVYAGEPSIGSSTGWGAGGVPCSDALRGSVPPCESDGGSGGILSSNATINPLLAGATKAWLGYCSGDGFSGTRVGPVAVNASTSVYFGGAFILEAVLAELLGRHGMARASAVVLAGCSAGGASVFQHADYVAGVVQAGTGGTARFAAAPGAGFLLDTAPYNGQLNTYTPMNRWVYETVGANASGNAACIAAYEASTPGSAWRCFMPQYALPYITTPLFVANSAADAAQMALIMKLGCSPAVANSCNASQLAYLDAFHVRGARAQRRGDCAPCCARSRRLPHPLPPPCRMKWCRS